LRFVGTQEGTGAKFNAVKDFVVEGKIPELIRIAETNIKSQIRDFTRLGRDGRFFTAPEYPNEV
jgi:ATP-dependent DNA helicase RecG